jgi:glycine C-acetyltransferase/8-amino-7-oxononanoate synthase
MGLSIVARHPELIARLQANAHTLRQGLRALGLSVNDSPAPIIALELGDSANMQRIQRALAAEGILIAYMAAYAGLGPEGILRIAVFSSHTDDMLKQLILAMGRHL